MELLRTKKELLKKSQNSKNLKQDIKQLSSKFVTLGNEIDAMFEGLKFEMKHFNHRTQFYEKFSSFYKEILINDKKSSEYVRKFMLAASKVPKDHEIAKALGNLRISK